VVVTLLRYHDDHGFRLDLHYRSAHVVVVEHHLAHSRFPNAVLPATPPFEPRYWCSGLIPHICSPMCHFVLPLPLLNPRLNASPEPGRHVTAGFAAGAVYRRTPVTVVPPTTTLPLRRTTAVPPRTVPPYYRHHTVVPGGLPLNYPTPSRFERYRPTVTFVTVTPRLGAVTVCEL